jgi:hypothetical protein
VRSRIFNIVWLLYITAVGIPLPANLSKQNGLQIDENDPVSSGDCEIHPLETSRPLPPEGGSDGTLMTGIIYSSLGDFM